MPDIALNPELLTSKPEVVIAVMGAKFDALRDAVLARMDAADARHREFEITVRETIQHEAANRKMADAKLERDIGRLDEVERAMDRRRTVEKVVMTIGSGTVFAVGWLVSQVVQAGYLHR